jgi:hypothetical protein
MLQRLKRLGSTLLRWRRSRLQRVSELEFRPAYWRIRGRLIDASLWFAKRVFLVKQNVFLGREQFHAYRLLFGTIVRPAIITIALVTALEFIEFLIQVNAASIVSILHIPSPIAGFLKQLRHSLVPGAQYFSSLLSSLAQISGAFLALYFTAVSVVVSTVYARVQGDVRVIMLREKVGNGYVQLVAMLGTASVFLLASFAVSRVPGILNLAFVVMLGVASFFCFVQLGSRIFYFFDPTRLIDYVTNDLIRWVRCATPLGYRWRDAAFQAFYQREANKLLTTYRNIVLLANREEHLQSDALVGLAQRGINLLGFYGEQKTHIPTDSRWFRRTHKHKAWLTSSVTETLSALNTATSLIPETVPDLMWFESDIEETVTFALEQLNSRDDLPSIYRSFDAMQAILHNLAANFAVDEALHLFRVTRPPLITRFNSTEISEVKNEDELLKLNLTLGIIDIYALSLIQILLGLSKQLEKFTVDSLSRNVAELDWANLRKIYESKLARGVIEKAELLSSHLDFERRVEGRPITPLWYKQQIVAVALIEFIDKCCSSLLVEFEKAIVEQAETLIESKRSIFVAQLVERGLEGCNKFSYHYRSFEAYVQALMNLRKVDDRPCPTIDWEAHQKTIGKLRERLLITLAQASVDLASTPKSDKLPDYFGHAYAFISDECYRALATGNEKLFEKLFTIFFHAGCTAHDQLMGSLKVADLQTKIGFAVQPLIDIAEISGFAYLFSELNEKSFRAVVDTVWDRYLTAQADKETAAANMSLRLSFEPTFMMMFPRDHIRYAWEQDFNNRLMSRAILQSPFVYVRAGGHKPQPNHPSKIIRIIAGYMAHYYKPRDVFLAEYFMKRFDQAKIEVTKRAGELYNALNKEEAEPE